MKLNRLIALTTLSPILYTLMTNNAFAFGKKTKRNQSPIRTTQAVKASPSPKTPSKNESRNGNSNAVHGAQKILRYANTGVGSPYVWGGSTWSQQNRKILGADCSGFTQKSWGYPYEQGTEDAIPGKNRLTTKQFMQAQDAGFPWTRLDSTPYSASQPGDAMVRRNSESGHIFLVSQAENSGVISVEAKGKKYGIGYSRRSYADIENRDYKIIRRK